MDPKYLLSVQVLQEPAEEHSLTGHPRDQGHTGVLGHAAMMAAAVTHSNEKPVQGTHLTGCKSNRKTTGVCIWKGKIRNLR